MGDIHSIRENFTAAQTEYRKVLRSEPENTKVLSSLAKAYENDGKSMEAIRTMKRWEEISPEEKEMLQQYAEILLSADKLSAAGRKIRQIWDKNPDDLQTLNLLAQYYICKGDEPKAQGCLKKIHQIDPAYMTVYRDGGKRYHQVGDFDKAEKNLQKYLQSKPDDVIAQKILARTYESQRRYREAMTVYQKLSETNGGQQNFASTLERLNEKLLANPEPISEKEAIEAAAGVDEKIEPVDIDFSDEHLSVNEELMNLLDDEKNPHSGRPVMVKSGAYDFETLTLEDNSGPSPFDQHLDDEILANNVTEDFDNLVLEKDDIDEDEVASYFGRPMQQPLYGTGGPREDIMENAFQDEDVDSSLRRNDDDVLELNDGFDTGEEEPEPKPKKARPKKRPRPEPDYDYSEDFEDEPEEDFAASPSKPYADDSELEDIEEEPDFEEPSQVLFEDDQTESDKELADDEEFTEEESGFETEDIDLDGNNFESEEDFTLDGSEEDTQQEEEALRDMDVVPGA